MVRLQFLERPDQARNSLGVAASFLCAVLPAFGDGHRLGLQSIGSRPSVTSTTWSSSYSSVCPPSIRCQPFRLPPHES